MRTLNFLRIAATALALLPWLVFKWASDYGGNAVELMKAAWKESQQL